MGRIIEISYERIVRLEPYINSKIKAVMKVNPGEGESDAFRQLRAAVICWCNEDKRRYLESKRKKKEKKSRE